MSGVRAGFPSRANRSSSAVCVSVLLLAAAALASPPAAPPPVLVPDSDWHSLAESRDPNLQSRLEDGLRKDVAWERLVRSGRMAVGVVDLTDPCRPRFASVNGSRMMYAASLPKIAVLLAAVQSFEDGSLEETPQVLEDLDQMIRLSSNPAATRMIDLLGFAKIQSVLTNPRYRLFDPKRGGGLWVGKRYAREGTRSPDPLAGLTHAATADQVCRFYYLLATGRLVSPSRSAQMLDMLDHPGIHHKFVRVLENRAPGAMLYRKSGTWRTWHCDSVLVWGPEWRHYILVGLVDDPDGERIIEDLVPLTEEILRD